jgi:hypothetical protein
MSATKIFVGETRNFQVQLPSVLIIENKLNSVLASIPTIQIEYHRYRTNPFYFSDFSRNLGLHSTQRKKQFN